MVKNMGLVDGNKMVKLKLDTTNNTTNKVLDKTCLQMEVDKQVNSYSTTEMVQVNTTGRTQHKLNQVNGN